MTLRTLAQGPLTWNQLPPLPDPVGFAGAYAGVSNGALLVAGGANFPDNVGPWGETKKTWYDGVFVLETPTGSWKKVGTLPRPMAYGVALTVPEGLLCLGGADGERHYADAFLLRYENGTVRTKFLPPLPLPLANACGAVLGSTVYVAGGIESPTDTTAERMFLTLTFSEKSPAWQRLPAWPGPGRMLAVAGAQDGSFFLFSGTDVARDPATGGIRRQYLRDAYAYRSGTWSRLANLPRPAVAAPSPAYGTTPHHLLVFGGDDGTNADKTLILKEAHPGFRTDVLAYDPRTNTWTTRSSGFTEKKTDAYPNSSASTGTPDRWAPVTTPLVIWNDKLVLPNGEVRPGVRTNRVLMAKPVRK